MLFFFSPVFFEFSDNLVKFPVQIIEALAQAFVGERRGEIGMPDTLEKFCQTTVCLLGIQYQRQGLEQDQQQHDDTAHAVFALAEQKREKGTGERECDYP